MSVSTAPHLDVLATDERAALAGRLMTEATHTMELLAVQAGRELGLYAAVASHDGLTAPELAATCGIDARYAREWLEQQAVAGWLTCDDAAAAAEERRFRLPAAQAEVLLDETSPYFSGALADGAYAVTQVAAAVKRALRDGGGVRYGDFGPELRHAIAALNRPGFDGSLATEWLPALGAAHRRLLDAASPRVLDLGCGAGASTVALARALPRAEVVGVDLDDASVAEARDRVVAAGLADRVRVVQDTAAATRDGERFDLVTVFEALHDMGDPVGALRAARATLRPGGTVLVADERVAEHFTAPGDDVERLNYAFSVFHCLPATMAEDPVEANGTVLRPATVRRWAADAGLAATELDVDHDLWRFYRLDPVS